MQFAINNTTDHLHPDSSRPALRPGPHRMTAMLRLVPEANRKTVHFTKIPLTSNIEQLDN